VTPIDRSEEDAKLELVQLDVLDDGEFTASDPDEEDDGDEWLKSIVPCADGVPAKHVHIKVATDEKQHKRRFF